MAAAPTEYRLGALAVIPFRAQVSAGRVEAAVRSGEAASVFEISYPATIPLVEGVQGGFAIPTQLCTTITVKFKKLFAGDATAYRSWVEANSAQVVRDEVLPRINGLLLAIKASSPDTFS